MEIEYIAKKLEPLMPKYVSRWRRTRELVDRDLRDLLDKKLRTTARKYLGDFQGTPLLSLPKKSVAQGSLNLGILRYEEDKWPFGLRDEELLQHVGIFGRSGSGKTNVLFHMLLQLTDKKVPWLFLDWKRTGRHLLPLLRGKTAVYTPGKSLSPFPFSLFTPPPGLEEHAYINLITDIIADAYQLGEGAQRVLQSAIQRSFENEKHAISDVLSEVERSPAANRVLGWKTSALRALESLHFTKVESGDGVGQQEMMERLLQGSSVVELDGLDQAGKKVLIAALALWLFYVKLSGRARESLDFVLVVEEAHHVMYRSTSKRETPLERLLRECREIGIGVIVVDQHCSLVSRAVLGNTFTSLFFNQKDPTDKNVAMSISRLDPVEKEYLNELPIGRAVCILQDRWTKPVLLKLPHVPVPKGAITDEHLKALGSGAMTLSAVRRAIEGELKGKRRIRIREEALSENDIAFLEDVANNRDSGVDARYKRLGWSVDKGQRAKSRLVHVGWIEEEAVAVGRTRRVLLRLTKPARAILGPTPVGKTRESIAHEFWKQYWARRMERLGYAVRVEAPRVGGRVDILATRAGESVAVEIETGKSTVRANVKKCLLSGFTKVMVVATNKGPLQRVERELAQAGLLIHGRVEVYLRDEGLKWRTERSIA